MPRYQKKIYAGDVLEIEEYYSPRVIGKGYGRGVNKNLTPAEQKEINLRQARKKLSRLLNANFGAGDLFITLTHAQRVGYTASKKALANFLRRLRYWRKKRGLGELKYIAVTEHQEKREHHHLIVNGLGKLAISELTKLWGLGRVLVSELEVGGEYTGLAHYITKEPQEKHARRWCQSKNLIQPRVVVRMVSSRHRLRPPLGFELVEKQEFFSPTSGEIIYHKYLRLGGEDWAEGITTEQWEVWG